MITNTSLPSIGNAVRLFVTPPASAVYWRILRRTADAFTGAADAGAVVVADQCTDNSVLDAAGLVNGTPYFYRDYAWNGSAWIDPGMSVSATPGASYADDGIDPQSFVRERIELGMAVEVGRGMLQPTTGKVQVLTAPFALADNLSLPAISVHMDSTAPAVRALGEDVGGDDADLATGAIGESEGWLARMTLAVVGVSLNPDERISLRRALRRVIIGNLQVFDSIGMIEIEFSQSDTEDFTQDGTPLYYSRGSLTFQAPAFITASAPPVSGATVTVTTP